MFGRFEDGVVGGFKKELLDNQCLYSWWQFTQHGMYIHVIHYRKMTRYSRKKNTYIIDIYIYIALNGLKRCFFAGTARVHHGMQCPK